jgi:hypothetical protein
MKCKTTKRASVSKIIRPIYAPDEEQAEIILHDGDHLYREIRIANRLRRDDGQDVCLIEGVDVDVSVEANEEDCHPRPNKR